MKSSRSRRMARLAPEVRRQLTALQREIQAVVRRIPRGRVLTYGQVAELAGRPGASRLVGATMRATASALGLPWQRVVGSHGKGLAKIAILDPVGAAAQRALLEKEGVELTRHGRIELARFGLRPDEGRAAHRRPRGGARRRGH
jgi:methylated-DNA-protein-cysteine methyltransferase related protein